MNASNQSGFASRSILLVLCAALAAGLGLMVAQRHFGKPGAAAVAAPKLHATTRIEPARELPAFELRASDGSPLTAQSLRGHWTLVFLGFTHCPDVCPTTLQTMARLDKRLTELAPNVHPQYVFVSLDPDRDSPAALKQYAAFFSEKIVAVTGANSEVAPFAPTALEVSVGMRSTVTPRCRSLS